MRRVGGVYVVTARHLTGGRDLEEVVSRALAGGAGAVQLREKDLPAAELYRLAARLLPLVRRAGALLLINDRVDVALAAGADGVHLSGASLPVRAVRRLAGPRFIIGASVHSREEAVAAAEAGADYLVYGNVFETASKPGRCGRGVEALAEVCCAVRVPVLAIGGIGPANAALVAGAGAAGVAVMSAAMAAPDPAEVVRALQRAWEEALEMRGRWLCVSW